jgi:uncharacterized protein YcbK (DUF882 family)
MSCEPLYDYSQWPNFTKSDLVCQETGKENPNVGKFSDLMDNVQYLRTWAGVPFYVSSAYRSPEHSIEARKANGPGQHSKSAIDFRVATKDCHRIVKKAFEMGFTGIGINLTGDSGTRFIHLDERTTAPRIWSY